MGHGPGTDWGKDNASGYKSRLGVWLFIIYTIIYAAFVAISVLLPEVMALSLGGQTLAVIYGMFLLVLALIMGLIYNKLCTAAEDKLNK